MAIVTIALFYIIPKTKACHSGRTHQLFALPAGLRISLKLQFGVALGICASERSINACPCPGNPCATQGLYDADNSPGRHLGRLEALFWEIFQRSLGDIILNIAGSFSSWVQLSFVTQVRVDARPQACCSSPGNLPRWYFAIWKVRHRNLCF
jgi:hypothetical protein